MSPFEREVRLVLEQINLRKKMMENLVEIQTKNPSYTLRAYAKKLRMSHSALSEILRGKRRVSKKLAERIVDRLNLDPKEAAHVIGSFRSGQKIPREGLLYHELSFEHFKVVS